MTQSQACGYLRDSYSGFSLVLLNSQVSLLKVTGDDFDTWR